MLIHGLTGLSQVLAKLLMVLTLREVVTFMLHDETIFDTITEILTLYFHIITHLHFTTQTMDISEVV